MKDKAKAVEEILYMAESEERLDVYQGALLFDAPLLYLGAVADAVRQRLHPLNTVTFVKDRNISYTNICVCGCKFCAFFRAPGAKDSYLMPREEILKKIEELVRISGTQVMLQGGLHPDLTIEYFEELFREIKKRFPVYIHSLSAPEIDHIAGNSGLSIEETLKRLASAGLDSLPGGGAEILVDDVKKRVSPKKLCAEKWFDVMETAHRLGMKSTATMVFGLGESYEDRVRHMVLIRELQDKSGGFRAFIPWSFSSGNTKLKELAIPGGIDYLKTLAISRIIIDNVSHIHSGWVTEGKKLSQVALSFGADDIGGIMMEERVLKSTGIEYEMIEEDIIRLIRGAGRVPALRDTEYNILKVYDS